MTKKELIDVIAEKAGSTKVAAATFLDAFTETVTDAVTAEEKVSIIPFGTFYQRVRKAGTARNPKTGKKVKTKERRSVAFRASRKKA